MRVDEIERVQRRFTRYAFWKASIPYAQYASRCLILNLQTLEARRLLHDMVLLFRVVNGLSHSGLVERIALRVLRFTSRTQRLFYIEDSRYSGTLVVSPLHRIQIEFDRNFANSDIDLFAFTLSQYKEFIVNANR